MSETIANLWPNASPASVLPLPRYSFALELVTPAMSEVMLGNALIQRRIRPRMLDKLLRAIAAGDWKVLPFGIILDQNGRLLDGQHRLKAIVKSGKAQYLYVVRGCPSEYFGLVDDNSPKNSDDILLYEGVPSGLRPAVGMATRALFRLDLAAASEKGEVRAFEERMQPGNDELREVYKAHPSLLEAANLARSCRNICPTEGGMAFVLCQGLELNPDRTRAFAAALRDYEGLQSGDPAHTLRKQWERPACKRRGRKVKEEELFTAERVREATLALDRFLVRLPLHSFRGLDTGTRLVPRVGR